VAAAANFRISAQRLLSAHPKAARHLHRTLPQFANDPPYKKFLRGFGYEGESSTEFSWGAPGFGEAYKKALREPAQASKSPASAKSSRALTISSNSTLV